MCRLINIVSQKSSPPKTFCGIFSPGEPLPKQIPMSTPILVHLSECVKCIIFTGVASNCPQILRIQFSFVMKFMNFS